MRGAEALARFGRGDEYIDIAHGFIATAHVSKWHTCTFQRQCSIRDSFLTITGRAEPKSSRSVR